MFEVVAAHGIYAATASIGYLPDFMNKVARAASIKGTKYIHVIAPCPTGWGCAVDETVELARRSSTAACGIWRNTSAPPSRTSISTRRLSVTGRRRASTTSLIRAGGSSSTASRASSRALRRIFARQGRFRALSDGEIEQIERQRDVKWRALREVAGR